MTMASIPPRRTFNHPDSEGSTSGADPGGMTAVKHRSRDATLGLTDERSQRPPNNTGQDSPTRKSRRRKGMVSPSHMLCQLSRLSACFVSFVIVTVFLARSKQEGKRLKPNRLTRVKRGGGRRNVQKGANKQAVMSSETDKRNPSNVEEGKNMERGAIHSAETLRMAESGYGTRMELGTAPFVDTAPCQLLEEKAEVSAEYGRERCVTHYPFVDLEQYQPEQPYIAEEDSGANGDLSNGRPRSHEATVLGGKVSLPATIRSDLAVLTRRGRGIGHENNQDRAVVVSPYVLRGRDVRGDSVGSDTDFFMGLFDGHGMNGHAVSHFASSEVVRLVSSALSPSFSPSAVGKFRSGDKRARLRDVVGEKRSGRRRNVARAADRASTTGNGSGGRRMAQGNDVFKITQALDNAFVEVDHKVARFGTSGSTGTVTMKVGSNLFVANTGDSRSFVATYQRSTGAANIVYMTRDHKPHIPEERHRIESLGGEIYIPFMKGETSRVLLRPGEEEGFLQGGVVGLAMSRSIGDGLVSKVGVIANPTVDVINIDDIVSSASNSATGETSGLGETDIEVFAVAMSDGLFDHVPAERIAQRLGRALFEGEDAVHPLVACEELILEASDAWGVMTKQFGDVYRDDITLAFIKIKR